MYEIKYRDESEIIESGIEWLSQVPYTWGKSYFKYHVGLLSGFPFKSENFDLEEGKPLIRIRDILKNDTKTYYKGNYLNKYLINQNDLLIGMDGDFHVSSWKGPEAILNQRVLKIFSLKGLNNGYLRWLLINPIKIINDLTYFTTVKHLSTSDVNNIEIFLPKVEEQQKIANFLDIKTAQFDNIITKKEQLIKKIKESKKSLISEVVTGKVKIVDGKLVDRDFSEMKDSGVEEFGYISKESELSKIKFHGDFKAGISKSADYFGKGYPFVNYPDVYKNKEISDGSGLALITPKERIDFSIKKGDVFFTRTSETIDDIGESCICKSDIKNGSYSGFIIRYRIWDKTKVEYNYLKYYFQNSNIKKWFARQLNIVTRASLSQDKLKELPLILPSYEEQKNIGIFLEEKTYQINLTIHKTFEQIKKLKQAKQSLISEAVTGKIDLRDWEIIEEGELQ